MNHDEIIRMAREAGSIDSEEVIETVYAAFAAAEREACARLCADYTAWGREWGQDNNHMAAEKATNECAAAIRAMGNK